MKRILISLNFPLTTLFCVMVYSLEAQPAFINPIPIPPLVDARDDTIRLEMRLLTTHQFNPADQIHSPANDSLNGTIMQAGIETWCYNLAGDTSLTFLGPTLKWHTGEMTHIQVTNMLPQPATTHWHGAEVPAQLDGGPHQPIAPGTTWHVDFRNLDNASTMWYHPHIHNNTYPQVQLGLSGMIISEQAGDPIGPTLPHTYGIDDIPIIIGDQNFKFIDSLNIYRIDTAKAKRPFSLVNGVTNPFISLPKGLVRLRILNGSTRKAIQLAISESYNDTLPSAMEDFILVATDGGYTTKPDTLKTLRTGPGARAEIIVDLREKSIGDTLYLRNLQNLIPNYIVGSPKGMDPTHGSAFLQLRVTDFDSFPDYIPVNTFTPFVSPWDPSVQDTLDITHRRTKSLVGMNDGSGFTIDSIPFDLTTINDTICVGAKEIWTIENKSPIAHPFHIHKIFFRILDIVDAANDTLNLDSLGLNGPKDDVLVLPGWRLRFLAKFDHYPNAIVHSLAYMYHCHILTHEDSEGGGMMHQFVVTDQGFCGTVALEERKLPDNLELFPNPTHKELFIKGELNQFSRIRIIDLQGRTLREQELTPFKGQSPINIKGLQPGFYLVIWQTAEGFSSGKLLIQ